MSKVAKATIILMIVTMLSKVFGFAREMVLTYTYGASAISDVYITSMSIPTTLFACIGTAIGTAFIPLFCEIDKLYGRKKSLEFTNNIFNVVIILGLILSLLTFSFTEPIVKIFAMNFTGEKLELAINFTKIMIFGIVFIGLSNMMTSWLQINNEFSIPGMIAYPFNICIMIGILLSTKGNLNLMAIGTLIGIIFQFLFQLPFAIKKGFKYKLYINLKDIYIKRMLSMIIPVFIGVSVSQLNIIVDKSLASTLEEGTITILNSANRLNGFVLGLFIATIASVIYPILSKLSNEDKKKEFSESIEKSINSVMLLIVPISIGAIVLAEPIVKIVFERGEFSPKSSHMTAVALSCYSIGMIGFGVREILNKVFYSLKDTKTPMINGVMEVTLNIILNLIFIKIIGYAGLALSTSIASIVTTWLLFDNMIKQITNFNKDKILKTTIKSIISSIVMGGATYFSYSMMSKIFGSGFIMEIMALLGSVVIGVIVYGMMVVVLRVEEINIIRDIVKFKLKRSN